MAVVIQITPEIVWENPQVGYFLAVFLPEPNAVDGDSDDLQSGIGIFLVNGRWLASLTTRYQSGVYELRPSESHPAGSFGEALHIAHKLWNLAY